MNKKYFKIFRKSRGRKFARDLEKLRDDFANRGLSQSSIREQAERFLIEEYKDEVAMKEEEANIYEEEKKEQQKERNNSIWTNRILAAIAILSFFLTLSVSYVTIKDSKEVLELNYFPSIDVQYSAPDEDFQIYNRGRTNLYIWGSSFNNGEPFIEDKGRLITPSGLPYHFPGEDLNQKLATLLRDKADIFIPFELFLKDSQGERYISKHYFYIFRGGSQLAIDVQTTTVDKYSW